VGLVLGDNELPDNSYRLKWIGKNFDKIDRPPMRRSLGCHLVGSALPVPDTTHMPSALQGAVKRVAAAMPPINRQKLRRLKRFVIRFLNKNFQNKQFQQDEHFDFSEWIEQTPYERYRKDELILVNERVKLGWKKKYKYVKSFIKDECYPEYKHPRGIYSRTDEYKCLVGPFFAKLGDIIFDSKFFIKHVPVCDRPQWLLDTFADKPNVFCTDFSKFEATFVRTLMKIELSVYAWFLKYNPNKEYLLGLIQMGMMSTNRIEFRDFCFNLMCKRMSGEMNTSVGNGIFNLVLTFFLLEESGNRYYDGRFEGDDGICWYSDNAPTVNDYRDMGSIIKIDVPLRLSEASFCGQIFDVDDLDVVCDPFEVLASFGYTTRDYMTANRDTLDNLIRAKSLSYLYQYPACPIIRSLALMGLRVVSKLPIEKIIAYGKKTTNNMYEKHLWIEMETYFKNNKTFDNKVKINTRLLVERKYNISIELQLKIEEYLDSITVLQPLQIPDILQYYHKDALHFYDINSIGYCSFKEERNLPLFSTSIANKIKIYIDNVFFKLYP